MKEVKIQIPNDCELIKDGDTYIVREKKQIPPKSWEEFCERYPKQEGESYIDSVSFIGIYNGPVQRDKKTDKNICISKKEAEAFLALMQLRQLRKAWIGDWEHLNDKEPIGVIHCSTDGNLEINEGYYHVSKVLSFPSYHMAYKFHNYFKKLCETAKSLL